MSEDDHKAAQLKQWLDIQFSTPDIAIALALLEGIGLIQRATVKPNAARPGWIITASDKAAERGFTVNGNEPVEEPVSPAEPDTEPNTDNAPEDVTEPPTGVEHLAVSAVKSFEAAGRGYQGNRALCESEAVLRGWLQADHVAYDKDDLAEALGMLETATLPGSNSRLIRGEELRRLTGGSPHTLGAKLPARCMGLFEVNPWSGRVEYERADIEPYLLPPVDGG